MLAPEKAREVLMTYLVKDVPAKQARAVAGLPSDLRKIAYIFMGRNSDGKPFVFNYQDPDGTTRMWQDKHRAMQTFDFLSQNDRLRILEILFPRIASHVERTLEFMKQTPYPQGYTRRSFRAPHYPEATLAKRFGWLSHMVGAISHYQEDISWLASWASYIDPYTPTLGTLFAAVIDAQTAESQTIFDILIASARGEHEIGGMGRHVVYGLLGASRPDGWTFIENMLLAAQREEGLRQSIFESVDEAHPQAFQRMLRLILDHDLARFSSVVRAMNVWFGFAWDSENVRTVNTILTRALTLLDSPEARAASLQQGDGEGVYLALWATAFEDALSAIPAAEALLADPDVERRFAAVYLLSTLGLIPARHTLFPALDDPDLHVAACAAAGLNSPDLPQNTDLFERVERVLPRFPEKTTALKPLIYPWWGIQADRASAAQILLYSLENRSPKRLIPYLNVFGEYSRMQAAEKLARITPWDDEIRDALIRQVGDRSQWIRKRIMSLLEDHEIRPQDALHLEGLLKRKASDLRRGVLSLLMQQDDESVLVSAGRLLTDGDKQQRLAGLELLRLLAEDERAVSECRTLAEQYQSEHGALNEDETMLLNSSLAPTEVPTLDDGLGLFDPAARTRPIPPKNKKVNLGSKAANACLTSLDDLIHEHRTTPVVLKTWQGEQELLLGNVIHQFPRPDAGLSREQNIERLPLHELWETWWKQCPDRLRGPDGFELLRASVQISKTILPAVQDPHGFTKALAPLYEPASPRLRYPFLIQTVLQWLVWLHPPLGMLDFLLDTLETILAALPKDAAKPDPSMVALFHWSRFQFAPWAGSLALIRLHYQLFPTMWENQHHAHLWQLLRWLDETFSDSPRHLVELYEIANAYRAGTATEADLYALLLAPLPPTTSNVYYHGIGFTELHDLSRQRAHPLIEKYPFLKPILDRCRERILEVELRRGDMPTAASLPAQVLRSVPGAETFVRLLRALGNETFTRGYSYGGENKRGVFSHLIQVSYPLDTDTLESFAAQVKAAKITQKRLIEAAVYAPQWAGFAEQALEWEHFADAVWWIHAHTKDSHWSVDQEIRDTWQSQISERTPLSGEDLLNGAVDVAWFWRVYHGLSQERWNRVYEAAKYSSGGSGHTRARLFADAMLGKLDREAEIDRMLKKRHQDSARALGLLPLPTGEGRDQDLLARYQALQEFLRTSRQYGSMRQANEKLAVRIAMENLARSAGYPDPARLQWAMEAQEIADLREGPVTVTADGVSVALSIDDLGKPQLEIYRQDKKLKSVPAALKKNPDIVELRERKQHIEQQASRMRLSLENAMCRGDEFTGAELHDLLAHPVLAPMLEQVIFTGEGVIGYPVERGNALQCHDERLQPVGRDQLLRIAHPHDLFASGEWDRWQRECFLRERIQPFKQVFRELYLLTDAEKQEGAISRRYAGHQVQPRQAAALFGQRGWVIHYEEGVMRTFHDENLSARISVLQGYFTPAEVEGVTLEGVLFTRPGTWQPLMLVDIPPRVFSEVMRDLDLVVSVAHRGGIDPESSASTVEMRAALIRETCTLLNIRNVTIQSNHALIEGQIGHYSVHLGSAIVHRQPGGALCIIPVHAQHRGRLFLPFADNDPKTAEVLSKILLLARDQEIKDPTILAQIRAMG